jgi:hypothetical protein
MDWHYYHEDVFGCRLPTPTRDISIAELAKHNSFDDCWTSIAGVVYKVTEYLALHPGGSKVIMECAGTSCDERFHETHGEAQEVLGRLSLYAIGRVNAASCTEAVKRAIETTVRVQNTLTNNTAFCAGRHVPFYAYCDALVIFAETGLDRWKTVLPEAHKRVVEMAQETLIKRFLDISEKCWKDLGETPVVDLEQKEDEIREVYLREALNMHKLLDGFKSSFLY